MSWKLLTILGAVALAVIGGVVEGVVGWDEVQQWIRSSIWGKEEAIWQGQTVGQLVDHLKGERLNKETIIYFSSTTTQEQLMRLLVSEKVGRVFRGKNFRSIINDVCNETQVCLECKWSYRGYSVTLVLKHQCTAQYPDNAYYIICRRKC